MLNRTSWVVVVLAASGMTFARAAFALDDGAPHNGLSSQAFRFNALSTNEYALNILLRKPLDAELFSVERGYIGRQLLDPHAQAMLTELVSCALNPGTKVSYDDPRGRFQWRGEGEIGLCPAWPGKDDPEKRYCQEIVTACIMARVNAMKRSIPISLRTERALASSPVSSLNAKILTDIKFRENSRGGDPMEGSLIEGFSGPLCHQNSECNWKPAYVGTCAPGESIQLAVEDTHTCELTTLRACAGIHGCIGDGSLQPSYTRYLTQQKGACSPLSFACPTETPVGGYYSVMVLPPPANHSLPTPTSVVPSASDAPKVVRITGTGRYPALEADVFAFLEGAFYGNMFKAGRLKWSCELNEAEQWSCSDGDVTTATVENCRVNRGADPPANVPAVPMPRSANNGSNVTDQCSLRDLPVPYRDVYACYSYAQQIELENDELDAALLNSRICDLPHGDAKCFPHPLRRCHYKNPEINLNRGAGCDWIGADGAYGRCPGQDGDSAVYRNIITTYLNEAGDLIRDDDLATKLRSTIPPITRAPAGLPTVHPRRCGCSSDAADGAFGAASLAALVALVLRGRRRRCAG